MTIACGIRPESKSFDVAADGTVGHHPAHERCLMEMLGVGLLMRGSAVVRQFLTIKTERLMPNGKKMWIPEKNVYGVAMGKPNLPSPCLDSITHTRAVM